MRPRRPGGGEVGKKREKREERRGDASMICLMLCGAERCQQSRRKGTIAGREAEREGGGTARARVI